MKVDQNNKFNIQLDDTIIYNIADFFKVFSDSTRVRILYTLIDTELNVSEITEILSMNQTTVSHQLKILRLNHLVKHRKEGKTVIYSLDDSHVEVLLKQTLEHLSHK